MHEGLINIAIQAAYNAGEFIQQESRNLSRIKIEQKSKNDYVTNVDKTAEEIIISTILKTYPKHNILSEEIGFIDNGGDLTWIIDPLDGTTNYIHSNPNYSISIAVKLENKITHGVVFDPNRNDVYSATLGSGAFLNNKRIRVNSGHLLSNAIVANSLPHDPELRAKFMPLYLDILDNCSAHRNIGSAALELAYVAAGYLDGYYAASLKEWDIAAGSILVKEAGGLVVDFNGKPDVLNSLSIVAASPKLITPILQKITQHIA